MYGPSKRVLAGLAGYRRKLKSNTVGNPWAFQGQFLLQMILTSSTHIAGNEFQTPHVTAASIHDLPIQHLFIRKILASYDGQPSNAGRQCQTVILTWWGINISDSLPIRKDCIAGNRRCLDLVSCSGHIQCHRNPGYKNCPILRSGINSDIHWRVWQTFKSTFHYAKFLLWPNLPLVRVLNSVWADNFSRSRIKLFSST